MSSSGANIGAEVIAPSREYDMGHLEGKDVGPIQVHFPLPVTVPAPPCR